MKRLVVYYSRTGTTKKAADALAFLLKADKEQILDAKSRRGPIGYLKSGKEASLKKPGEILAIKHNPLKYDLVIIGTPIWYWTVSSPIRAYLTKNKFRKVAFFCTFHSSGAERAFKEMQRLSKKPIATLTLKTREIAKNKYIGKVKEFADKL